MIDVLGSAKSTLNFIPLQCDNIYIIHRLTSCITFYIRILHHVLRPCIYKSVQSIIETCGCKVLSHMGVVLKLKVPERAFGMRLARI